MALVSIGPTLHATQNQTDGVCATLAFGSARCERVSETVTGTTLLMLHFAVPFTTSVSVGFTCWLRRRVIHVTRTQRTCSKASRVRAAVHYRQAPALADGVTLVGREIAIQPDIFALQQWYHRFPEVHHFVASAMVNHGSMTRQLRARDCRQSETPQFFNLQERLQPDKFRKHLLPGRSTLLCYCNVEHRPISSSQRPPLQPSQRPLISHLPLHLADNATLQHHHHSWPDWHHTIRRHSLGPCRADP